MGIDYAFFNHDRKQYIDIGQLGWNEKYLWWIDGPFSQLLIHQLVHPGGYTEERKQLIGNWHGDRVELLPDQDNEGELMRERYESVYEDITVFALRQLRLFDLLWANDTRSDGTVDDLLKDLLCEPYDIESGATEEELLAYLTDPKMRFMDRINIWLHRSFGGEIPQGVTAYCFNLIENAGSFNLELIGSSRFDPNDPDWACEQVFEGYPRSIKLPEFIHQHQWNVCLERVTSFLSEYLDLENQQTRILKTGKGIGLGFVDGELEILWTE